MAKVLSSISGNLISAASAGFAPTNSGDVSAIASGYQVVSATGTQLYAGTAYLTEVNSTPISAERAGKAANASMANSAYYDGTGRLISALPDSAAVSSIASAYATSKQDASGMSAYAKSADVSGTVNTVANKSGNWDGVYNTVYYNSASWSGSTGGSVTSPSGTIVVMGDQIEGTNSAVLTATSEPGFTATFAAQGGEIPSWTSQELYTGTLPGSGATLYIPTNFYSENGIAIISGRDSNMAIITASGAATGDPITIYLGAIVNTISASANSYIQIKGELTAEKEGGIMVTGIGELAWASSVSGVVNTVSSNSATWGQGGVDSATVSSIASSYAESAISSVSGNYYSTSNPAGYITGVDLSNYATTGYVDSSVSSKADSSALSSYALSSDVSGCIDTVSSNSASWTQVVTSLSGNANFYNQINSKNISSTVSYKARCDENGNSISALYDTVSSNSATWGQGGAVTSPSGTIYVSGSTIEASNSALDVKYTPDWSAEIDTEYHFYPNDGFSAAVSGSGNLYLGIMSLDLDSADIYVYGLPDGVLIGSGTYEYNYRGTAEISFAGGYSAISACPSTDQIMLNNQYVTASGAGYYTTSVGTLAWETSIQAVANSSQATANGVLYILTGNA